MKLEVSSMSFPGLARQALIAALLVGGAGDQLVGAVPQLLLSSLTVSPGALFDVPVAGRACGTLGAYSGPFSDELASKTTFPVAVGEGPERMRPDLASGCQVIFGGGSGNICFQIRHSVDFGRYVPHLGNGQAPLTREGAAR